MPDLNAFQEIAKTSSFYREDNAAYPGHVLELNSSQTSQIYDYLSPHFNHLEVGSTGRLRKTLSSDNGTQNSLIHTDHRTIQVLIYLQLPPGDTSEQGTFFYEHSYFKEKKIPPDSSSTKVHYYDILFSDENFHSWNCWKKIQPVVNRAIIFDGSLFHSGPPHITGNESHPRMTIEFSLLKKDFLSKA